MRDQFGSNTDIVRNNVTIAGRPRNLLFGYALLSR